MERAAFPALAKTKNHETKKCNTDAEKKKTKTALGDPNSVERGSKKAGLPPLCAMGFIPGDVGLFESRSEMGL